MIVSILGNSLNVIGLETHLPRDTESIICDNHPEGMLPSVEAYCNRNDINYVCYKLEDLEITDPVDLSYLRTYPNEKITFPRNDLTVYHADYIILFGYKDNLYTTYIYDLCEKLGKKYKMVDLSPPVKFSRDPE